MRQCPQVNRAANGLGRGGHRGILDGEATVEQVGARLYQQIVDTASGQPTKSEELGFGDEEFAPWQLGAVM